MASAAASWHPGMIAASREGTVAQEVQRRFGRFLESFRLPAASSRGDGQGDAYYVEVVRHLLGAGRQTLVVHWSHLSHQDGDLQDAIQERFAALRPALDAALASLAARLRAAGGRRGGAAPGPLGVAFRGLGAESLVPWGAARSAALGRLVAVRGAVAGAGGPRPELLSGAFQCGRCKREVRHSRGGFCGPRSPGECPFCGSTGRWTLLERSQFTRWGDQQRARLVPAGAQPVQGAPLAIDVIFQGRDACRSCEACKLAADVVINGCFVAAPHGEEVSEDPASGQRRPRSDPEAPFKTVFLAVSVDDARAHAPDAAAAARPEALEGHAAAAEGRGDAAAPQGGALPQRGLGASRKRSIGSTPGLARLARPLRGSAGGPGVGRDVAGGRASLDAVAEDVAPSVHGHFDIKKAILLMLIGGVPREQQADYSYRSTLHICLIGETATAKSVLLRWAAAFSPRGVYVSGSSSSAAGLTAALVPDESELDGRSIRPGALIMAGGGVCCIDDFEQLPERDQGSIREAMDQQVVSLSKAGVHTRLNAAASVLLACSHGGLGESALRVEDVMPLNVAACFDLTFTLRDDVDAAADGEVARWMVASACGRHAPCLSEEPKGPQEERLRRHVRLARGLRPELTDAASARLQDSYVRLRQAARGSESAAAGAAAPSPRLLTALIRLSEAVARARLASEVQEVDVDEALSLLQSSVGSASQSLRARPSRSVPAPRGKRACVGSLG